MSNRTNLNVVLAISVLALVAVASPAMALPCGLTPPRECSGPRETVGYSAGVFVGTTLVNQIWSSPAVGESIDNWGILNAQVTTTIPAIVANAYRVSDTQYTKCRVQGLLDGTVCRMNVLNPLPGCQLDGVDWGHISASVYCGLSIELGGLADVEPWFIRPSPGMCGQRFELYCEETYRYSATAGEDALAPAVVAFLNEEGVDPLDLVQQSACVPYTTATFADVFNHSVYIDCSYTIPVSP